MSGHERFEELSALAASGQISSGEWQDLRVHLETCAACADLLGDFGSIGASLLAGSDDVMLAEFDEQMRSRLLNHLCAPAMNHSGGPAIAQLSRRNSVWRLRGQRAAIAGLAAVLLVGFVAGVLALASRKDRMPPSPPVATKDSAPPRPSPAKVEPAPPTIAIARKAGDAENPAAAAEKLQAANRALERERTELTMTLAASASIESDLRASFAGVQVQLEAKNRDLAAAQADRADVSRRLADTQAALEQSAARQAAQAREIALAGIELEKLRGQLELEKADAERAGALLAGGKDGQSIIAARNLHIIDVYDADSRGKRRSFGRVFYVEGQELIFYAYDLADPRHANAQFYAWGDASAPGQGAIRLGILHNDGATEQRWVLKYNDASVLARLDSIFVTVETTANLEKPKGRRVLFAVLAGRANHP